MKIHLIKRDSLGPTVYALFVELATVVEQPLGVKITTPDGKSEIINFSTNPADSNLLIPEGTQVEIVYKIEE